MTEPSPLSLLHHLKIIFHQQGFMQYFSLKKFMYCNDVRNLMMKHMWWVPYWAWEWRWFKDSSNRNLEGFVHNSRKRLFVPVIYTILCILFKKIYQSIQTLLEKKIRYKDHQYLLWSNFKAIHMICELQLEYTKYKYMYSFTEIRKEVWDMTRRGYR